MDPRKEWYCKKCGHVYNERSRLFGYENECPNCLREEAIKEINTKFGYGEKERSL